jgi:hypothetical protein
MWPEQHPVSIMVRIDRMHGSESKGATHDLPVAEAQELLEISRNHEINCGVLVSWTV